METIFVYLDDVSYAQPLLESMSRAPQAKQTHWVLVACAPRITHRVSKWVSNRSRENWRNKWADKLFADAVPLLEAQGCQVTPVLARGPLAELVEEWRIKLDQTPQIVDLRRPKLETQKEDAGNTAKVGGMRQAFPSALAILAACLTPLVEEAWI